MRVRFEISGGFGSSPFGTLATEMEDSNLPDAERRALHETLDAVEAGDGAGLSSGDEHGELLYRLRVDERDVEVVYDDMTMPVDVWPLVELLRDRAIAERIERHRSD
jgi:hypothetical protein